MCVLHVGFDIGSTTTKAVVFDDSDKLLFSKYGRHFADLKTSVEKLTAEIKDKFSSAKFTLAMAGSGALDIAHGMDVPFTQEQIACSVSVARFLPGVDVSIELGGEDSKITFFDKAGAEQRMNETCAGGTGAFIDQMATLFGTDAYGLNELAKYHKHIYPIASRCGVFAKTDVQALLNDGASREDIAASIFQAIVNQTISGLACGRKITGKVAFLGGPLYFLTELRKRFTETLKLTPDNCIFPKNPHLFVAMGAAITSKKFTTIDASVLTKRSDTFFVSRSSEHENSCAPLFKSNDELESFRQRHSLCRVKRADLSSYRGKTYLGIDVGSTTTKLVLLGQGGELLFSRYMLSGAENPLAAVREALSSLYSELHDGITVNGSCVTGYGEKLIKAALGVDIGEVETVTHSKAADFILPGVDFVIDIGGQDMKCLKIKNGVIDNVFLNEACSSGCGSFLQSFAKSLNIEISDFARYAEESRTPVDLGSRCTVFMNSRVRQAQKEGASIQDISAGLVYSVVKNALYKVLKIKDPSELGKRIVVQGGTFKNDALLRAFELVTGINVIRPDISELMGAFGAALIARERQQDKSTLLSAAEIENFTTKLTTVNCGGCGNNCLLTITHFPDGKKYVSGNRCERGDTSEQKKDLPPNLYEEKYSRLFDFYKPLSEEAAFRGTIGIPRVLNMYENYPFWFTFFTELGFRVVLSEKKPDESYGIDTIPSQTLCYPAKLVHRHVTDLILKGIKTIFYPIILHEKNEFAAAQNNYNCPVVTGYPDVARINIDILHKEGIDYIQPALAIEDVNSVVKTLSPCLEQYGISKHEVRSAAAAADKERAKFKSDITELGKKAIRYLKEKGGDGIVLAGHPYHLSPEINHGIPQMINGFGVTVFTEDSIAALSDGLERSDDIGALDQWVYHSRLYRAAIAVSRHPDLKDIQLVQFNSFGCGLDAISTEQTADILRRNGKFHTLIKIDEGKNIGAVKIRIRSLLAAMKSKESSAEDPKPTEAKQNFAAVSLVGRTILCPPLSPFHFQFIETIFADKGINIKLLPEGNKETVELGLRYVNNDVCYPSMMVVGQFIEALKSGKYDPNTTDCLYVQTGGPCRASNYIHVLRCALDAAGFKNTRILALNSQKEGDAVSLSLPKGLLRPAVAAMFYGDLLMRLVLRTRPYEKTAGSAQLLHDKWAEHIKRTIKDVNWFRYCRDVRAIVADFNSIEIKEIKRPRVGITGEILVKYHANANENLIKVIEEEGGEAVVPDISNFLAYCMLDPIYSNKHLNGAFIPRAIGQSGLWLLRRLRAPIIKALKPTRFGVPHDIRYLASLGGEIVSCANQGGEGWLLTAEMASLMNDGIRNVLCLQPFACLPNHITGKGVIKALKEKFADANILPLDYDASVSTTNQLNRLKLLMATARA
ncbi:MAG: acyl-CoA dehydratase activase-related protein [Synergistes sp.]|nr:acyl-CoA dehydratase activase-related protein [Synergistes sp.]